MSLKRALWIFSILTITLQLIIVPAAGDTPAGQTTAPNFSMTLVPKLVEQSGQFATFSIPLDRYARDTSQLPIGVFDSGIGGLTVLEEILKIDLHNNQTARPGADGVPDFAGERFIYLGDQANMPYGNYSSVDKTDYLRELIQKDLLFLLGNRYWESAAASEQQPKLDKLPVKAIVIACNTATAYGLDDLRQTIQDLKLPVPVIGVVEAGGRGVIDLVRTDPTRGCAVILATVGTCDSGAYPKTIAKLAGQQGLRIPAVFQQGSVGLAGAIEGNQSFVNSAAGTASSNYQGPSLKNQRAPIKTELANTYGFDPAGLVGDPNQPETWRLTSVANYIRYDVTTLVEQYRQSNPTQPITTVVLGCTHFPLAQSQIREVFDRLRQYRDESGGRPYRNLIAENLQFVNPGEYTAKELFRELFAKRLKLPAGEKSLLDHDQFFITVPSPNVPSYAIDETGGLTYDYKYGRKTNQWQQEDTRAIPIGNDPRGLSALTLWREKLPEVAKRLPPAK